MPRILLSLAVTALLGSVAVGGASAQQPAPTSGHKHEASTSTTSSKLIVPPPAMLSEPQRGAAWTEEKWNEVSGDWQKQPKWTACQKEASDRKLQGSDAWTVIAVCMNRT
jgi:hypothetical protein